MGLGETDAAVSRIIARTDEVDGLLTKRADQAGFADGARISTPKAPGRWTDARCLTGWASGFGLGRPPESGSDATGKCSPALQDRPASDGSPDAALRHCRQSNHGRGADMSHTGGPDPDGRGRWGVISRRGASRSVRCTGPGTKRSRAAALVRHAAAGFPLGRVGFAALLALALPLQAQAQTTVWSATLTPRVTFSGDPVPLGCDNTSTGNRKCSNSNTLSDDFTDDGTTYAVTKFFTRNGVLTFRLNTGATAATQGLTLVIDSEEFVLKEANQINGAKTQWKWNNTTLGWTAGTDVAVSLVVTDAPATGQPTISGGGQVGKTLTAATDDIEDPDGLPTTPTFTYQWVRVDGSTDTDIPGATSETYTLTASDLGKQIKVKVSFTDLRGHAEGPLTSDAYPRNGTVTVVVLPGPCPAVNDWCTTMTVADDGAGFGYEFDKSGSLDDNMIEYGGKEIEVVKLNVVIQSTRERFFFESFPRVPLGTVITVGDLTLTTDAESNDGSNANKWDYNPGELPPDLLWSEGQEVRISLVLGSFPSEGAVTISGTARKGLMLTADVSDISDPDGLTNPSYTYQWVQVDGTTETDIPGATEASYTPVADDVGKQVKIRVSFTDDRAHPEAVTGEAYPSSGSIGDSTIRSLNETFTNLTVQQAENIGDPVRASGVVGPVTYRLEGEDANKFMISSSNGQLSTRVGERYDYEEKPSYVVTVNAVSQQGQSVSILVIINIVDLAERPTQLRAPTVSATAGSITSLDVSWTAPSNVGRPPITHYNLRYREDSVETWTDGPQNLTDTAAQITGLTADTPYQVGVQAVNHEGSVWSGYGAGRTDAPTVSFGASAYTAIEGVQDVTVTVELFPAAPRAVTILLTATPEGGATAADWSGVPESITFAAGETEQTFTVTATDDTVDDDGESLQLGFDALPSGVLLGSPATVALVEDVDVSTWYVWFGESSYTVTEGGTARISVHLNSPWKPELNEALTVPLFDPQHQGGASAADYSGVPESVTFQRGQTQTSFTVRATADSDDDDGERVLIQFRRLFPDDLEVGRYGARFVTLHLADTDGETAVTVSFDAANYTAAEGGAAATVRVRLDTAPGRAVTIPLTPSHRGASADDYSGLPASVTFGASETEKSFTLTATDDSVDDDRESVAIGFGSLPSKVSAGSPSEAVVQLTDNDSVVSSLQVRFDASAGTVRDGVEEGGSYRLGFRLSTKPGQTLTIPLTYTYLGGATAADFTGLPANVTFAKNATSAGVTIRPVDDFEEDPGESLKVSFGTLPAGVSVSSLSGGSTIIPVIDNDASPGLSVADASAREWPNKKVCLLFEVTMDLMDVDHEVSVDYATVSGTAVAGQDFKPISGTLVFRPSESRRRTASKSLCVEVLDDSHDEGVEEMTLVLSNPVRAHLVDGTGTGHISNTDKMPGAWLTRFGRVASDHVVEAVEERWQEGPRAPHLRIGGRAAEDLFDWGRVRSVFEGGNEAAVGADLSGESGRARMDRSGDEGLADGSPAGGSRASGNLSGVGVAAPSRMAGGNPGSLGGPPPVLSGSGPVTGDGPERAGGSGGAARSALMHALGLPDTSGLADLRDVLMGSSFFYSRPLDENGRAPTPGWLGQWSAWGRTAASRFSGADGKLSLDGEAATAMLGFDSRWNDRWLAGVVLSHSQGQGAYTHPKATGGAVASTMTGVHPYARYEFNERTSLWGVLGYGVGGLSLTPERSGTALETDLTNAMMAFGGRTALSVRSGEAGRFELAIRSDARLTNTASDSIEGLVGAAGQTGRLRVLLEGSGSMRLAAGGVLKPKLEAGLRYDAGDAETGAGLEVGGGLGYAAGNLSVEVNARALVAHEDTEYGEWGLSGSVAYAPGRDGRGLSMRLGSAWGSTQSGVQSLWSRQDASGLARNAAFEAAQRFQAELGYGIAGQRKAALWMPFIAAQGADGGREMRLGVKFASGPNTEARLEIGRNENGPGAPEHAVQLRGALRW